MAGLEKISRLLYLEEKDALLQSFAGIILLHAVFHIIQGDGSNQLNINDNIIINIRISGQLKVWLTGGCGGGGGSSSSRK